MMVFRTENPANRLHSRDPIIVNESITMTQKISCNKNSADKNKGRITIAVRMRVLSMKGNLFILRRIVSFAAARSCGQSGARAADKIEWPVQAHARQNPAIVYR